MTLYDTSFELRDTVVRARHGRPWTPSEEKELRDNFLKGCSLPYLCEHLQRPATGVLIHLTKQNLLLKEPAGCYPCRYFIPDRIALLIKESQSQPETKEIEMSTPTIKSAVSAPVIQTKTFIAGRDAAHMSDDEIFDLIADLEFAMDKLKLIRNQPKKLVANIEKMQADVAKLVEYVDGR